MISRLRGFGAALRRRFGFGGVLLRVVDGCACAVGEVVADQSVTSLSYQPSGLPECSAGRALEPALGLEPRTC